MIGSVGALGDTKKYRKLTSETKGNLAIYGIKGEKKKEKIQDHKETILEMN